MKNSILILILAFVCLSVKAQNGESEKHGQELLLGGCWFIPHDAMTNIRFYKDFTFKFNDFDTNKKEKVVLTGTYKLDGNNLLLNCNDGQIIKFDFFKGEIPDNNYYIKGYPLKTSNYYFVHGECE